MSLAGWNAEGIDPAGTYEQLPVGDYVAAIIDGAWEPVSNHEDKGKCIKFTWQVKGGEFDGRLFFQRLLLMFTGSEKTPGKTVEIAQRNLSSISHATGKMHVATDNGEEMFHIPCSVRIGTQKNNPEYTEVRSVKPLNGAQSATGGAPVTQTTTSASAAANAGSNVPSFMRKQAS